MFKKLKPAEVDEYIFKAALNKEPVFESYKKLCEIQDNQYIDYVNFECKYYEFYHGSRDISIKRSSEKSSPVSFCDLPIDVVKEVMGKLDTVDRLVVRKVSHDLRNLFDDSKQKFQDVMLYFDETYCELHLDNWRVVYDETDGRRVGLARKESRDTSYIEDDVKWRNFDYSGNVFEKMIEDAMTISKNPKLEVDYFEIQTEREVPIQLVNFLESLKSQIRAKELYLRLKPFTDTIIPIFKSISPKTLKNICCDAPYQEMEKIMEMDLWEKAETFEWRNFTNEFPIEKFFRFKDFNVSGLNEISEELLVNIRDVLLKLPHFDSCSFEVRVQENAVAEDGWIVVEETVIQWDFIDGIMSQNPAYDSETHRFMIPNSSEYFQFGIVLSFETGFQARLECLAISRTSLHN